MHYKRLIRNILASLLIFTVVIGCIIGIVILKEEKYWIFATGTKDKAFLNATWGMSEREVERANNTALSKPEYSFRFMHLGVLNMKRYKERVQTDVNIFGDTKIRYVFFDDKLFEVTVSLESFKLDELNNFVVSKLTKKYGEGKPAVKRDCDINCLNWDTEKVSIDYWLMKQEKEIDYLAGIRLTYKPIYNAIKKIDKEEEDKLF